MSNTKLEPHQLLPKILSILDGIDDSSDLARYVFHLYQVHQASIRLVNAKTEVELKKLTAELEAIIKAK